MEKIVLLLSGGLDSSVLLSILSRQNLEVLPLFIDYGQRSTKQEYQATKYFSDLFRCKLHTTKVRSLFRNSLLIKGSNSDSPFLPHRNLLFLVMGAIFAANTSCNAVAIGIHGGSSYPDSTLPFVRHAAKSIKESIGREVIIHAPFLEITKRDIAYMALAQKLPINKTYSCYKGGVNHCKRCSGCVQRFDSLSEAEKNIRVNL